LFAFCSTLSLDERIPRILSYYYCVIEMDIDSLNGGSVIAMRGDGCVTIGSDLRLGSRFLTIVTNKEKIYKFGEHLYLGIAGLGTDAQTIVQRMTFRKNMYELRENRPIKPETFMHMLSNMQYEKRFGPYFCEPIVAGLHPTTFEPYIAASDSIGCIDAPEDFVAVGTAQHQMIGTCESFWEKNMDQDNLFEATSQSLLSALERDAASGWGAIVYTVTKDAVTAKTLQCRLD